jgi:hypothetical protein
MTDQDRDDQNLTDYMMRACHGQLVLHARVLASELLARGLPGDVALFDVARLLSRGTSTPRAEPLTRPT